MLYFIHGTDTQKARKKTRALVDSLLKREPDASHFRLDDETLTSDTLAEYLGGQGLFAGKILVVLDRVFRSDEGTELVLERVKDIADSDNIFVLLEGKLDAKTKKRLEKHAKKSQSFNLQPTTSNLKPDFNIFSLTDALGNRDSKRAWVLYQEALRAGSRPEEIHGMLFWQTKAMLLVAQKSTTGLKPFVVKKATGFLRKWTDDELQKLSSALVAVYHDARLGKFDLEIGLERLVLNL